MVDYSREIQLVRRLDRLTNRFHLIQMMASPLIGIAAMLGRTPDSAVEGLSALRNSSESTMRIALTIWKTRYGAFAGNSQRSAHVRNVAIEFPAIGKLSYHGNERVFHDVCGIPVAVEPHDRSEYFYSPANPGTILAALNGAGTRWLIDGDGNLARDTAPVPSVMADQTRDIIERTRPHTTCRAWVLWGPPRGGKSVAARQIAHELGGGWVRLCGSSSRSQGAWDTAIALQSRAIILDDLDCNAGHEDALLGLIERAREHCRVIISTANILPGVKAGGPKEHELRGAILAPGRAADERPRLYATLDPHVRQLLAPSVHESLRHPDLLAAYLTELENRKHAHGVVTMADVDEMLERMRAVGDR